MRSVRILVELTDDLDPDVVAVKTDTLTLNGRSVEIDLSQQNHDELVAWFERYHKAGRKPGTGATVIGPPKAQRGRPTAERKAFLAGIQVYAKHRGIELQPLSAGGWKYPDQLQEEFAADIAAGKYTIDGNPTAKADK
jgi:Lsr2